MFKKGDVVSVSYRRGYDKKGNPVMETYDRCVVEEMNGSHIKVSCRIIGSSADGKDSIEIHTMSFDINSPDFVGIKPQSR